MFGNCWAVHVVGGNRPAEAPAGAAAALALEPADPDPVPARHGAPTPGLGQSGAGHRPLPSRRSRWHPRTPTSGTTWAISKPDWSAPPEAAGSSRSRRWRAGPGTPTPGSIRGHAPLELHRLGDAIASFERAIDLSPGHAAWLLLGSALEQAQRLPDALALLRKVVALDPDNLDGWLGVQTACC